MRETKIKNRNSGITLIALVITIIVMLILVAVTINMAVNGGLFDKAGEAVGKTQDAIDREKDLGNGKIQIGETVYNSIDEYLEDVGAGGAKHVWKREGDTFTCQKHTGEVYTMGAYVNYTTNSNATADIDLSKLGMASSGVSGASTDAGTSETGTTNKAKIKGESTGWIVFGGADKNADGTYNTLLITTDRPVGIADATQGNEPEVGSMDDEPVAYGQNASSSGLPLKGAAAYNNGPSEINRICKELYSNSEYGNAQGMTIENVNDALYFSDVGTIIGGMYYDGSTWYSVGNLTTKLKNLPAEYWTAIKENCYTPASPTVKDETGFGNYELNGYAYQLNDEGTGLICPAKTGAVKTGLTPMERTVVFGASADYVYWLASRGVRGNVGFAGFGPGTVYVGVAYSCNVCFYSYGYEGDGEFSLRPVVSLTSKLPTLTGTSISTEGTITGGGPS